ncbi:MAG: sensor domain-containing diguanylate cyclase [Treponema sp.]|uniref:diguanylate cyclase DgcA n=1 Tax=Treponema sp. TaxID=166 RepID=UPI00257B7DD3|nr:diguanylate cyclase DgcA [Treponema sp.]MBQ9101498.1 sensor domain-containing diguanylate cyclase [Treponema sp.]
MSQDLSHSEQTPSLNPEYAEIVSQYEKKIYDLKTLLEISRSLCSTIEFSQLIESILYTCMGQFRVLGAGVFVPEPLDSDYFVLNRNYNGLELDPNVTYRISVSNPLINVITKNDRVFTIDELKAEVPVYADLEPISSLEPSLIVPLVQRNHLDGILVLGEKISLPEEQGYSSYEKELILTIASLAAVAIYNSTLLERSSTDMMTHLKLKYFFYNVLTDKLDAAMAQNLPLAVIMFDIDFFKRFNDTYGHACGDYVLQTVAKIIRSCIRSCDLASRYGGEEFTVMLDKTGKDDAMTVAERIRQHVEEYDFCYENQHVKVTISIGVTVFDSEKNLVSSPKQLVDQADQALYVSKRSGRNRVTFADERLISEIKITE